MPCEIFSGLPRSKPVGKTRTAIEEMTQTSSAIYIAGKHEIVGHAVRIYHDLTGVMPPSLVWLEGKNRTCRTGKLNCDNCSMKPDNTKDDHIEYTNLEAHVGSLVATHRIVTQEIIEKSETDEHIKNYGGLCAYQCLKIAAKKTRYIFTVPQLVSELPHKELLVIDEEPTFMHFFTSSALVCEYTRNAVTRSTTIHFPVETKLIREKINNLERMFGYHKDILMAIELLDKYYEVFSDFKEYEWDVAKLFNVIADIPRPEYSDPKRAIEWLDRCHVWGDYMSHLEAILFPAKLPFLLEASVGKTKIMMIGEQETRIRDLPSHDRSIIIGSTLAKELARKIYDEVKVRTFSEVGYLENFCVIPFEFMEKIQEETDEEPVYRYSESKTKKAMRVFSKHLFKDSVPHIVVTGSKEAQEKAFDHFVDDRIYPELSISHNRKDQFDSLITGRPNIIYANSNISRGIDLDFYDVEIMYHCDFTTPYQSAMITYYEYILETYKNASHDDMRSEKYKYGHHSDDNSERSPNSNQTNKTIMRAKIDLEKYKKLRESIIADETVNLAFRIAPIIHVNQFKLLIAPNKYINTIINRMMMICDGKTDAIDKIIFPYKITNWEDVSNLVGGIKTLLNPINKKNVWDEQNYMQQNDKLDALIIYRRNELDENNFLIQSVRKKNLVKAVSSLFRSYKESESIDPKKEEIIRSELRPTLENRGKHGKGVSSTTLIKHIRKKVPTARKEDIRKVIRKMEVEGKLYQKRKGKKAMYYILEESDDSLDDFLT